MKYRRNKVMIMYSPGLEQKNGGIAHMHYIDDSGHWHEALFTL